ncbi:F-box only protein 21-like isoform X2 [Oratosquilla oratoria]|uniref:F-box only protein 21-like isoform X2 n=1 Tax=Oratosquilla oratoria TaxID=337810 RepID=UPI003F76D80F
MADEGSCGLLEIPDEILIHILKDSAISHIELCNLSCTCSRFRSIASTQHLWKLKLKQHWEWVNNQYPENIEISDWKDEYEKVVTVSHRMSSLVSSLSQRLFQHHHLTTHVITEVDALCHYSMFSPMVVIHTLRDILDSGDEYENLTEKYYSRKVIIHAHQHVCRQEWAEFLAAPTEEQSLEKGAILLARWFQPHKDVSLKQVRSQLNDIAKEVLTLLRTNHPNHPALSAGLVSHDYHLQESIWNENQCTQIFKCINHILFYQMKIVGNTDDYYNIENSMFNSVLTNKRGIPITLSIVYAAICHRLGIYLEPVNYPSHFLMRWKVPGSDEYEYVDAFNKGRRLSGLELLKEMPMGLGRDQSLLCSCGSMQVFQRMIRNIMNVAQMLAHISDHMELFCSATELLSLLSPNDRSIQELLLRIYYTLEVHYDRIVVGCRQLLDQGPSTILTEMLGDCETILDDQKNAPEPITPKHRVKKRASVVFVTGLIMRHKRYSYNCVIFGWDEECKMTAEWVQRMGVQNLQFKTKQPFYNVLVSDGSQRYAAQENLEILGEPVPITHSDVGKYFKTFQGCYYVPNAELSQEYPDDELKRREHLEVRGWL